MFGKFRKMKVCCTRMQVAAEPEMAALLSGFIYSSEGPLLHTYFFLESWGRLLSQCAPLASWQPSSTVKVACMCSCRAGNLPEAANPLCAAGRGFSHICTGQPTAFHVPHPA